MTRTTFKEKSMKNQSLVTKEASTRQHQNTGRPNHTHNPPDNFPQHQTQPKERMYMTFGQEPTCICGFLAKNPRMYLTFIQKPVYTEKKVVKSRPKLKLIKGSVNV